MYVEGTKIQFRFHLVLKQVILLADIPISLIYEKVNTLFSQQLKTNCLLQINHSF